MDVLAEGVKYPLFYALALATGGGGRMRLRSGKSTADV
jgi:hypothetical protein